MIPVPRRRALVIGSIALYVASTLLLSGSGNTRFAIVSLLPVVVAGYFHGPRVGLIGGLVAYPVNALVAWALLGTPEPFVASTSAAMGSVSIAVIGWLVGYVVTLREEALGDRDRAESLFGDAFEHAPIGMAIVSMEGRFERVNPRFAGMLGRSREEVVGMNWREISPETEHAYSQQQIEALINGDVPRVEMPRHFFALDDEREGMVHISVVPGSEGHQTHILVQMADITELRQANIQLRGLIETKDRFVASVAHELRTPLTGVLGYAEILRDPDSGLSPQERAELVAIIAEEASDLSEIVEDLLVTNRIEHGTLTTVAVPVDLRAQTAQVLEAMGLGDDVCVAETDPSAKAIGDPGRVRQILRNLLTNARKHGGPDVRVVVRPEGDRMTLTVIDNGNGVPPGHQDKVFDPYHRAYKTPGQPERIGLGLTVAKALAENMGGGLTYGRVNGETVFQLTLTKAVATDHPHSDEPFATSGRRQPASSRR